MKFIATVAGAFLLSASCAYADDPYANLYANTLVYTTAKNVVIKVLVQKDGTWTSSASDGKADSGAWATLGNYTCVSDAAMPNTPPGCDTIKHHEIGDKWTQKAMDGTTDQVTLTAGR
jgi:hypothetical protein